MLSFFRDKIDAIQNFASSQADQNLAKVFEIDKCHIYIL